MAVVCAAVWNEYQLFGMKVVPEWQLCVQLFGMKVVPECQLCMQLFGMNVSCLE